MCLAVKKLPGEPAYIVRQGKFFRYGSSRSAYLLCHPRSILCSCSVFLRILRLIVAAAYHIVHRAADILNALTDTTGHIFSGVADIISKGISIPGICTVRTVGIPIGALRHIIYIVVLRHLCRMDIVSFIRLSHVTLRVGIAISGVIRGVVSTGRHPGQ